jgi:hypothetical protein
MGGDTYEVRVAPTAVRQLRKPLMTPQDYGLAEPAFIVDIRPTSSACTRSRTLA